MQPVVLIPGEAIFDCYVATFNIAGFVQPFAECCYEVCTRLRFARVEISNYWYRCLLSPGRQRPRSRSAAEQRDELAAPNGHRLSLLLPRQLSPCPQHK